MRLDPEIQKSTVRMSGAELDLAKSFAEISERHDLTPTEEMCVLTGFTVRMAREALKSERTGQVWTSGKRP